MEKPTPEKIKAELKRRHDAGKASGDDSLNLDALQLIEALQAEIEELKELLKYPYNRLRKLETNPIIDAAYNSYHAKQMRRIEQTLKEGE